MTREFPFDCLQRYLDNGFYLVPISGKAPQVKGWQDKKMKDLAEFNSCVNDYTTGAAFLCGSDSGVYCLDVDPRNGGLESLKRFENEFGTLPKTVTVETGGGGFHYYFHSDKVLPKKQSCLQGVDFQGHGSLAIIPGSTHPSGNIYKFLDGCELGNIKIASIPSPIEDLLHGKIKPFERLRSDLDLIVEGTRNEVLYKYASKLISEGLPAALLFEKISLINQEKCSPPLPSREIESICKSCIKSAKRFYSINDGGFAVGGESISNFHLRISTKISKDDGEGREDFYVLEGAYATGEIIEPITVSSSQFHNGDFLRFLDVKAIVRVGAYMEDHIIAAVKSTSEDIKTERIYSHTGFRKIDDRWVFLHTGGAISESGNDPNIKVDLGMTQLNSYELEFESDKAIEKANIKAALDFLDLAPDRITFAILGMNFRAPTASIKLITTVLFFCGLTGCFKSVMAALKLCFFGRNFSYDNLTASFESTPNFLEKLSYILKDLPSVVDDLAPDGSLKDSQQKAKNAARYIRASGNGAGSGRGRLTKDCQTKTSFHQRGQTDMTGEDLPSGQSVIARLLVLPMEAGLIDKQNITRAQDLAAQGVYVKAMTSYISWLCGRYESLRKDLPERLLNLRSKATNISGHSRTADSIANLALGFELLLQFAIEKEVVTTEEAKAYEKRAWMAFKVIEENQRVYLTTEDPCKNFISYLRSAMLMGKAHMKNYKNIKLSPFEYEAFGWFHDPTSGELVPKGLSIGWVDLFGEEIIFDPDAALSIAQDIARSQGTSINLSRDTLIRRLAERGLIVKSDSEGKNTVKRSPGDEKRKRFLIFKDFDLFMDEKMNSAFRNQTDKLGNVNLSEIKSWQKKLPDAAH